jgi:hypothetical protein
VYVGQNTNPNGIAAFAVQADASLTPVSGSPFPGPSNNIVGNSEFLFGTDRTNIATYARQGNGVLSTTSSINGSACAGYPGYWVTGLTLDPRGSSLYAGQGTSLDNCLSSFAVQGDGSLAFQSSIDIGLATIWSLQFSPTNQVAYGAGCARMQWVLYAFQRSSDGQLISFSNLAPGVTLAIPPPNAGNVFVCPLASAVSAKGYLAVAYSETSLDTYQNLSADIGIYQINASGTLTPVSYLANATTFTTITALNFDPTGTYLAVAGQNGIETFNLNSNGTLSHIGSAVEPTISFIDARWDNNGYLYAISNAALYVFTSNSGVLSLAGTPYPIPATSLAVLPVDSNQN